jgi:hypothetical protein
MKSTLQEKDVNLFNIEQELTEICKDISYNYNETPLKDIEFKLEDIDGE